MQEGREVQGKSGTGLNSAEYLLLKLTRTIVTLIEEKIIVEIMSFIIIHDKCSKHRFLWSCIK